MTHKSLPMGAPLGDDDQPDLLHYRCTSPADLVMVSALAKRLRETGALDRLEAARGLTPEVDFQSAFREAAALGRSEDELNPDFYRPEVEAIVAARQAGEADWANPALDGVDDFGDQVYLDSAELSRQNRARIEAEEEEEAPWEKFMAPDAQTK